MPNRTIHWGLITLIAATLAAGSGALAQDGPRSGGCAPSDTACRLDGLERRLDYLIDLMERQRPDRQGGGRFGRAIDIPVNRSCGGGSDGCSTLAARLCSQGGFARGVPAETILGTFGDTTLVRATCMD
ncbi:hypothetical protein KOAAANKH_02692 [Brevundimonas sp. NIBR10]|jgi:hypothetical protein|uniref:hypothetical protein n=1 Tax=unclassified Brevundimonas TaxID=2622653 RepID=UPI0022F1C0BB|nr:hypothetical protein [Brevundimonas sp. NIBR10]WGM47807.1 hypothetical protein KOAAANKH_02692 [Brevundimonas sp. NIBR10]